MKKIFTFFLTIFFVLLIPECCLFAQQKISIQGSWSFLADPTDVGQQEAWFNQSLPEKVVLPGSMNGNGKGDEISLSTPWTGSIYDSSFYFNPAMAKYRQPGNIKIPFWLSPMKYYTGAAWYQKEVTIPASWKNKRILLHLERAHTETRLWVNDQPTGTHNSLVAPHVFELTKLLSPGKNRITLRIDNRIEVINVGPDSHSISDHTQGNWNGVIGKMELVATENIFISNIQVYPNLEAKTAQIRLRLQNRTGKLFSGSLAIHAESFNSPLIHKIKQITKSVNIEANSVDTVSITLPMGDGIQTWDEFSPSLYMLNTKLLQNGQTIQEQQTRFGMRHISIRGKQFLVNGRPVFLRGTLHNCEFPLTGYPSTDSKEWERIFRVAKSYGLNHMRFHSWCPPAAAFEAADIVGFYLQPEGPSWPNHGVSIGRGWPVDKYLYDETERMVEWYGNAPSFVMLSAGNEPAGNQVAYLNAFVDFWKAKDSRRVYTGMSVGGSWPVVPNAQFQVRGGVRGLTWDKSRPESMADFSDGLSKFTVPFVAHEMGQWCVFPDFDEIKEYKGFYRARNLELFREQLADMGMADQGREFFMASGKLQALCYKHEIEKTLRTPGYAGFQLLGLQDFPGQGTALVGVINAFYKPKAYIDSKSFSRFCNVTVPLASLPKFVYNNSELLEAEIKVAHGGKADLKHAIFNWTLKDKNGKIIFNGQIKKENVPFGNGISVGKISLPLSGIKTACRLNLEVSIANTNFINDWNIWVYPDTMVSVPADVYYTTSLDEKAKQVLDEGGKVFFNGAGQVVKGKEVAMYFQPVFWNTSWFKMRPPHVTGLLIQHNSAAFAQFPTAYHSDLQWWEIANRSQVMVLEDFPAGFKPLVQPIDTWFLSRKLALVFEVKVGKGKLIVSSAPVSPGLDTTKPAARQLFRSLMEYMASSAFNPSDEVSFNTVKDILVSPTRFRFDTYTVDSPDELKPKVQQQ